MSLAFGNRIQAARMQGMAARQSADGQPDAARGTMEGDRLHRVFRTAGHETAARAEQGADEALVAAQHRDEQAFDHPDMIPGSAKVAA